MYFMPKVKFLHNRKTKILNKEQRKFKDKTNIKTNDKKDYIKKPLNNETQI